MATGNVVTPVGANGQPIPVIRLGTTQNVAYNAAGGASTQSTAFGASTTLILIAARIPAANTGVRIAIASSPTATSSTTLIPASGWFYAEVQPGWKLAVLSDDTGTGTINITEAVTWG